MANVLAANAQKIPVDMVKEKTPIKQPVSNASLAASFTAKANAAQEAAIHNLFVDTNNDGKVSSAERNAHANDLLAHKDQIDRDKDGKISFQEELKWALDNGDTNASEINRFLATDTNNDGVLTTAEKKAYAMRSARNEQLANQIKK